MALSDLKVLYVCTDFPYPPTSGGLVDMWNRIQILHGLGITIDLIVTVATDPSDAAREKVASLVRRLIVTYRDRSVRGLVSLRASQAVIRRSLRHVSLTETYDIVLLQTEYVSDILRNATLRATVSVIRVDNDEYSYYLESAKAEQRWLLKLYYLQEALRVRALSARILPSVDSLWFVSHDELQRYREKHAKSNQSTEFLPTSVDLKMLDTPSLEGNRVLFVGNLWANLNREAVEWYVAGVHARLKDIPDYQFVVVGSARGKGCDWLSALVRANTNVIAYLDVDDLSPYYQSSAVFVNPMQRGAGVKLKTIEAVLRGLPLVSTTSGAAGSGLIRTAHYRCADTPEGFAAQVRELLANRQSGREMARNAQRFVVEQYDQQKVLGRLLAASMQHGLRPGSEMDGLAG